MDVQQQQTFIKVLACLAWADGSASTEEKDKLCELVTTMGITIDKKAIVDLIDVNREVTPLLLDEVKLLPYDLFGSLLVLSLEITNIDRVITAKEQEAVRQIADVHLDPDKVRKLFEWFVLKKKADQLFEEVFESAT